MLDSLFEQLVLLSCLCLTEMQFYQARGQMHKMHHFQSHRLGVSVSTSGGLNNVRRWFLLRILEYLKFGSVVIE